MAAPTSVNTNPSPDYKHLSLEQVYTEMNTLTTHDLSDENLFEKAGQLMDMARRQMNSTVSSETADQDIAPISLRLKSLSQCKNCTLFEKIKDCYMKVVDKLNKTKIKNTFPVFSGYQLDQIDNILPRRRALSVGSLLVAVSEQSSNTQDVEMLNVDDLSSSDS